MGFLLGIDEAGKGPVIGPLVIAGVLISEENEGKLKKLGIKDSKELSPEKRKKFSEEIKNLSEDFVVLKISASELNKEMDTKTLNEIEISRIAQIINSFWMRKPKVYIDALEANTKKFKEKILSRLKDKKLEIIAENYADKTYPIVSAASIIAKVTRDSEIKNLHKKYGFFGSGYPSDERTIEFLKKLNKEEYNKIVRLKWETSKNILKNKKQKKLLEF